MKNRKKTIKETFWTVSGNGNLIREGFQKNVKLGRLTEVSGGRGDGNLVDIFFSTELATDSFPQKNALITVVF